MKKYNIDTKKNETLYDWCIRKNNNDILNRWDYDRNNKTPKDIRCSDPGNYWFKCQNHLHDSEQRNISNIMKTEKVPSCSICGSFGIWCEQNNRLDLLKRWDYDLNNCSPYEISISSTKKKYFKCPRGIHKSELKDLNNIRKQFGSSKCKQCESIGQYGIDNIDKDFILKYWSNKNNCDPMTVNKNSTKKIWIKCIDVEYHPDYDITAVNFYKGKRCPYCSGKRIAKEDSVGYKFPEIFDIWIEKKNTPYDYLPNSNKKIYFKCEKHGEYRRRICNAVKCDFICPKCSKELQESKLQRKVRKYIEERFKTIKHEYNCTIIPINPKTNYKLPYDNEIPDIKLIIEVNGEQHYKASSFFYGKNKEQAQKRFEYRKELDKYKKNFAIDHGYNYLVIPYWADDKKNTWKLLIDNKIKNITQSSL